MYISHSSKIFAQLRDELHWEEEVYFYQIILNSEHGFHRKSLFKVSYIGT